MVAIAFPDDLVQAQREWHRTYRALATGSAAHPAELRRELLKLSGRIRQHPFWATEVGRSPGARVALRESVRAELARETSA